jgi:hypothetical protein
MIGGVMLAVTSFMNRLADDDNLNNERIQSNAYDFSVYNKIDSINTNLNQTREGFEQILGKDQEADTDFPTYQTGIWQKTKDIIFGTTKATSGTAGAIVGGFTLGFSIIEDLSSAINLPVNAVALLIGLLSIVLIFMLTKYIFGKEV